MHQRKMPFKWLHRYNSHLKKYQKNDCWAVVRSLVSLYILYIYIFYLDLIGSGVHGSCLPPDLETKFGTKENPQRHPISSIQRPLPCFELWPKSPCGCLTKANMNRLQEGLISPSILVTLWNRYLFRFAFETMFYSSANFPFTRPSLSSTGSPTIPFRSERWTSIAKPSIKNEWWVFCLFDAVRFDVYRSSKGRGLRTCPSWPRISVWPRSCCGRLSIEHIAITLRVSKG